MRSAVELVNGYREGTFSPVEVLEQALAAVEAGAAFNAVASTDPDGARAAALASARRWEQGAPLGPLDGVPFTVKDSFHVAGLPRWHGTAISSGPLSAADCAPVRRAREAGMLVVAKTTMPDYAMLMSGSSSQHGLITGPWDPTVNTAGSSAGAGVSVSAGIAPLALGTDMIGSVRLPAAVNGLASLKPTQGRIAYDPAGDYRSAGPMGQCVADVEQALIALGRHDPADWYALPGAYTRAPLRPITGRRIAVLRSMRTGAAVDDPTAAAVDRAADLLAAAGADLVEIDDLPVTPADHEAVFWFMVDKGLPDYLGRPAADRGRILPEIGAMLEGSLSRTAVDAARDAHTVAVATDRVARRLAEFDHVLSPALPVHAWPAGQHSPPRPDGVPDPVSHMAFACWFNRTAMPAGTVPVLPGGGALYPVGVQVSGRRFDDGGVLGVLAELERTRGFDVTFPELSR